MGAVACHSWSRRLLAATLFAAAASAMFLASWSPPRDEAAGGYNVILLTVDALRADHVGAYGYPLNTTPNMDSFIRASTAFENAYTAWPSTNPSFASMFTGVYPCRAGVERIGRNQWLSDDLFTLAEAFNSSGYATSAVTANGRVGVKSNYNQGFSSFEDANTETAGKITDRSIAALRKISGGRFFLWVHYVDPHWPYTPPSGYSEEFLGGALPEYRRNLTTCPPGLTSLGLERMVSGESQYERDRKAHVNKPDIGCTLESGSLEERVSRYDGEIRYADEQMGRLFAEIGRLGLYENTIIVLTADHGESLGENGYYFNHGRLPYNSCLRVPLAIYVPARGHRRVTSAVSLTDLMPSLLALNGLKFNLSFDGADVSGIMSGAERRRTVYAGAGYSVDYMTVLTDGRWKIIDVPDGNDRLIMRNSSLELYNLETDPSESVNLISSGAGGVSLAGELEEFLKVNSGCRLGMPEYLGPQPDLTEELRSLGYVG